MSTRAWSWWIIGEGEQPEDLRAETAADAVAQATRLIRNGDYSGDDESVSSVTVQGYVLSGEDRVDFAVEIDLGA